MQRARYDVCDKEVHQDVLPRATASEHRDVPRVEQAERNDLRPPPPAPSACARWLEGGLCKIAVRLHVQVETREGHHNVEQLMLYHEEHLGEGIELHDAFVVG